MESRESEIDVHRGNRKEEYRKLARNIAAHIPSAIASSVTKTDYLEVRENDWQHCSEFKE
jgi:hypothetical protein